MASEPLALFLCSYRKDLLRAKRLVESVRSFNMDRLPLAVAVPARDMDMFRAEIGSAGVQWHTQESIFASTPSARHATFESVTGGHVQQLVKSECWRLGMADSHLVLDSDCEFLRPFSRSEFLHTSGMPHTVLHQADDLFDLTDRMGRPRVRADWLATSDRTREFFRNSSPTRQGFGSAPFVWSAAVWRDLEARVLQPQGLTLLQMIERLGSELMIYGEALLALRTIPLHPVAEFFRCYHYEEQWWSDRRAGVDRSALATRFMGVVWQSNWQYWMDHPEFRKPLPSRISRGIRRGVRWLRWRATS